VHVCKGESTHGVLSDDMLLRRCIEVKRDTERKQERAEWCADERSGQKVCDVREWLSVQGSRMAAWRRPYCNNFTVPIESVAGRRLEKNEHAQWPQYLCNLPH